MRDYSPFIAAAVIMAVVALGWMAMPRLMLFVSEGGPYAGAALAVAFMVAFFAVFWLRGRYQERRGRR